MRARYRVSLAAALVAAVVAAFALRGLAIDNRLEQWTGHDHAAAADYRAFRADFGSDEFLLAVLSGPVLTADSLAAQVVAVVAIEATPGVVGVRGPAQVWRDLFGAEDVPALVEELTGNPFYRGLFVSADATATGLLVQVEPGEDPRARRELCRAVEAALAPLEGDGVTVDLVGSTALSAALDEVSEREARRALPLALVASLLVLALLLRSLRATVVSAVCAGLTVLLTMGAMAALGRPLTMITTSLPPLLWVLSLGNVVHLLQRHAGSATGSVDEALRHVRRPCVLASTTTAAGFLSLLVGPLAPVRELGLFAAGGILLALVISLYLAPALITLVGLRPDGRVHRRPPHASPLWAVVSRPRAVVAATVVFTVAAAACLPLIRVVSDPLSFLPEDHPTVASYRRVASRLGGFYTLEVVLQPPGEWTDPAATAVIDRLAAELEESPVVARAVAATEVLREIRRWAGQGVGAAAWDDLDPAARSLLRTMLSEDRQRVRISAMVNEMSEQRFLELVAGARAAVAELPAGWRGMVTGQVLQLVTAQQRLVVTQLQSLGLAAVLVFGVLGLGLGSTRAVALAVVPNLLPLLAAFAAMGLFGLPLDAATVTVASIALGIAVDNTAHLLERIRFAGAAGATQVDAVAESLAAVAPAMVVSSATAALGFLALVASRFVPIRDFGLLSAVAIGVALLGDLVVLPSSALLWRPRARRMAAASDD